MTRSFLQDKKHQGNGASPALFPWCKKFSIWIIIWILSTYYKSCFCNFCFSSTTDLFDVCFLVINVSDYTDRCAVIAIGYFNSCPFGTCMYDLAIADVHGYMVNAASVSIEEEVSGLCI